jgi:hypothetical protein
MSAKNLFQFLTDQDHFYVTLVAISSVCQKLTKEVQFSHKILSVVFKFSEVIHYVLAVGFKLNWFLVSTVILKFIKHVK